jgi:DNA-directed RNA polymerase subunit RPC12/RpoP
MFFTECARLAERHPDLAAVLERLDSQFRAMGTVEVLRPDDLASFLNIDPNQIRSALDLLARNKMLDRDDMIECPYCQMAVPWSDYQQALDEDGEYRCTSCDRALTDKTVPIITVYRAGRNWQETSLLGGRCGDTGDRQAAKSYVPSNSAVDDHAWYTHDRLAEIFGVGKEALRKRLDRYRGRNMDGWKENEDRRPREPRYLYQLRAVRPIIEEFRASSQRPAK